MTTLKRCTECGEVKQATRENFYVNCHNRDGFQNQCKACVYRKERAGRLRKRAENPTTPRKQAEPEKPANHLEREIEAFLAARKNLKPGTLKNYRRSLFFFAKAYPDFPPTSQGVTDFLVNGGYNDTTKASVYAQIRSFVNWLRKTKRVEGDPLEAIVRPRPIDLLPRAPKENDVKRVLEYLEGRVEQALPLSPLQRYRAARDLAAFSLMVDTGLRVGEVYGLEVTDIDLEEGTAFIKHTKNRQQRYVVFAKTVRGNLKYWLKCREELGLPQAITALFVSEWGGWQPYGTSTFKHQLDRYCQKIGVKSFSPHQLRHFCASQSIKNGQDIERLRQQLGHSDIKMTARYFRMPNAGRAADHLRISPLDNLRGTA